MKTRIEEKLANIEAEIHTLTIQREVLREVLELPEEKKKRKGDGVRKLIPSVSHAELPTPHTGKLTPEEVLSHIQNTKTGIDFHDLLTTINMQRPRNKDKVKSRDLTLRLKTLYTNSEVVRMKTKGPGRAYKYKVVP